MEVNSSKHSCRVMLVLLRARTKAVGQFRPAIQSSSMPPLRTLSTMLEMIKFGRKTSKTIIFSDLRCLPARRVSTMSAGGAISFAAGVVRRIA